MSKIELAEITDLESVVKIINACAADLISKNIFQWSRKKINNSWNRWGYRVSGRHPNSNL